MPLRYTRHARERMVQRRVSEAEAEAVVANPDLRYTGRNGNPILVRTLGGRRLKVVLTGDDPGLVITVGD